MRFAPAGWIRTARLAPAALRATACALALLLQCVFFHPPPSGRGSTHFFEVARLLPSEKNMAKTILLIILFLIEEDLIEPQIEENLDTKEKIVRLVD